MSILVVGGTGFIGPRVIRRLVSALLLRLYTLVGEPHPVNRHKNRGLSTRKTLKKGDAPQPPLLIITT